MSILYAQLQPKGMYMLKKAAIIMGLVATVGMQAGYNLAFNITCTKGDTTCSIAPQIAVEVGEMFSVENKGLLIEGVLSKDLVLEARVSCIACGQCPAVVSEPVVALELNKEATVTVGDDQGNSLEVSVTVSE